MKKSLAFVLSLVYALALAACSPDNIDKTTPVFETENINRVFFSSPANKDVEVPGEHLAKITAWLGTFTIDKKVDSDVVPPGTNQVSVRIEYTDGTVVENGISTITIDETTYFMKSEKAPQCFLDLRLYES